MQAIIYKGEDVLLTFTSADNMSAFTKVVKFFTFGGAPKTAVVAAVDNYTFTAKLAKADTADLPVGILNIVLEFTNAATDKIISKTIDAKLNDPYLNGGERTATDLTADVIFMQGQSIDVMFTTPPMLMPEIIAAKDLSVQKAGESSASAAQALIYKDAAAAIVSGGPKGVYATSAALISANPDHSYTYVVTADGNWYYWNGSTFVAGGLYQSAAQYSLNSDAVTMISPSAAPTPSIATGSTKSYLFNDNGTAAWITKGNIQVKKGDRLDVYYNGTAYTYTSYPKDSFIDTINLFNKDTAIINKGLNSTTGQPETNSNRYVSQYIKVPKGSVIFLTHAERVAQFDKTYTLVAIKTTTTTNGTIATEATSEYIRIQLYNSQLATLMLMLNEHYAAGMAYVPFGTNSIYGDTANLFKPNTEDVSLLAKIKSKIDATIIAVETVGKNKFPKATVSVGSLNSSGADVTSSTWRRSVPFTTTPLSDVICPANAIVCEYDAAGVFIPGTYRVTDGNTFQTSATCSKVKCAVYNTAVETFQFEYGTAQTTYEAYYSQSETSQVNGVTTVFKPNVKDVDFLNVISGIKASEELAGSDYLAIGDSLTFADVYQQVIAENLGMTLTSHCLGGITLIGMVDGSGELGALTSSDVAGKKLITLLGGYNDRGYLQGQASDLYPAQDTICGHLRYAIDKVLTLLQAANNLSCRLIVLIPHFVGKYRWIDADGNDEYPAGSGQTFYSATRKMIEVCESMGVAHFDLWSESGINNYNWNKFAVTAIPTTQYTYKGEFATVGELPAGVLNDAARVIGVSNAYTHNGTDWVLSDSPYPWNSDQLHLSVDGYGRFGSVISAKIKAIAF